MQSKIIGVVIVELIISVFVGIYDMDDEFPFYAPFFGTLILLNMVLLFIYGLFLILK